MAVTNPYDFITNPSQPPSNSFSSGSSKTKRILVVVGGAVLLIILVSLVSNLLGRANAGLQADYLRLVQQQSEIIRISDIGAKQARSTAARNLAVNTKISLSSSQAEIKALAAATGLELTPQTLALGINKQTDAQLVQAGQNNGFDEAFTQTMTVQLKNYQQSLQRLANQSEQEAARRILIREFNNINLLLSKEDAATDE